MNRYMYLIVNYDGLDTTASSGDILSFKIVNEPKINGQSISSFGWSSTSSGFRNKSVLAEVGFTWTLGILSGQTDSWCSLDDNSITDWQQAIIYSLVSISKRRSDEEMNMLPDNGYVSDVEDQYQDYYENDNQVHPERSTEN